MQDRLSSLHHLIGTAGWSIPRESANEFPKSGSHLQRYSHSLSAVEINSSFYRPHQAKTYARWARETEPSFRFAVKMAKEFTHEKQFAVRHAELVDWLGPVTELGKKLGALLIQIPPKMEFDQKAATRFFEHLRLQFDRMIALEPRHLTWASPVALKLLEEFHITKVEADPERCPSPVSSKAARYIRLHGSPHIYKSLYPPDVIEQWHRELAGTKKSSWVIFDNTTFGNGTTNALQLHQLVTDSDSDSSSSRKLSRRSLGAKKNIVPTVSKQTTAPKTAD